MQRIMLSFSICVHFLSFPSLLHSYRNNVEVNSDEMKWQEQILILFLILGNSIQSLSINYDVDSRFSKNAFYWDEEIPFYF